MTRETAGCEVEWLVKDEFAILPTYCLCTRRAVLNTFLPELSRTRILEFCHPAPT